MISTAFQAVFVLASTFGSTYFTNMRTIFMAGNLAISLVGVVMIRQLDATHVWPKFIGFCLSLAYTANIPLTLSMSSGNVGGFTKKSTVNAMVSPPSHAREKDIDSFSDLHRILHRKYHRTAIVFRSRSTQVFVSFSFDDGLLCCSLHTLLRAPHLPYA